MYVYNHYQPVILNNTLMKATSYTIVKYWTTAA